MCRKPSNFMWHRFYTTSDQKTSREMLSHANSIIAYISMIFVGAGYCVWTVFSSISHKCLIALLPWECPKSPKCSSNQLWSTLNRFYPYRIAHCHWGTWTGVNGYKLVKCNIYNIYWCTKGHGVWIDTEYCIELLLAQQGGISSTSCRKSSPDIIWNSIYLNSCPQRPDICRCRILPVNRPLHNVP